MAYPFADGCDDNDLDYHFAAGWTSGWDDEKSDARTGIEHLDETLDVNGSSLVDATENDSFGAVDIDLEDHGVGNYGYSECTGTPSMWLSKNAAYANNEAFFRRTARHEMGHLFGMKHSGDDSSRNGDNPPTMATCLSQPGQPSNYSQDDQAYLQFLHSNPSDYQMHANYGFEQGTSFWGSTDGGVTYMTSGGDASSGNVSYEPPGGSTEYMYQTIDLADGNDRPDVRARLKAKYTTASIQYRIALYAAEIDYSGDNGCDYADGMTGLNSQTVGAYALKVDSGWQSPTAAFEAIESSWELADSGDGFRYQVRVYSNVGKGGHGRIDNARGDARGGDES